MVGVGRPPSHSDEKGTAVSNNYQSGVLDSSAAGRLALPETVSVALEEIAVDMREGLLAVSTGLQVMQQLMEADVAAVCGPNGEHNPMREAVRHGSEAGSVTLGGRRVPVRRPRMRTADGAAEQPVPSYELFSSTEILGRMAMQKMLAGISTRRYPVGLESQFGVQGFQMPHRQLRDRHRPESRFNRPLDIADIRFPGAVLVLGDAQPFVDHMTQRDHRGRPTALSASQQAGSAPCARRSGQLVGTAHGLAQVHRLAGHRVRPGVDPNPQRLTAGLDASPGTLGVTPRTAVLMPISVIHAPTHAQRSRKQRWIKGFTLSPGGAGTLDLTDYEDFEFTLQE